VWLWQTLAVADLDGDSIEHSAVASRAKKLNSVLFF